MTGRRFFSLDTRTTSHSDCLQTIAHRARFGVGLLAVVGLLFISTVDALSQNSTLDFDDTGTLEQYGKVIERIKELRKEYRSAGARRQAQIISSVKKSSSMCITAQQVTIPQ